MPSQTDQYDFLAQQEAKKKAESAPLADRMRPQNLEEFIGQKHILAPGRLLRRAIQADQLSSLLFYGPPGTGKTTLARIIANQTKSQFLSINAVFAGIKDIRENVSSAKEFFKIYHQRTILFIDEVHRFNKSQQDALLPHVEDGTIILIGATTENPYFEVNKALISRSRIFQLKQLDEEDLRAVIHQALKNEERGLGKLAVNLQQEAETHLVKTANGDARSLLNALELAAVTSPPDEGGLIQIDLATAEESIQQQAVLYDKDGDAHYDTISAFIKSMRGSDPDAALYWMAKMVYAGEDPKFIFRRMIIFAGEDVGMADPNAINVVISAARGYDYIGMPEGRFLLAESCLYLSTTPKSNSAFAFFDALKTVRTEKEGDVPNHLKDGNRDKEGFGHGEGYLYPHAYRDHWVSQQYLPDALQGKVFYQPSESGYEQKIKGQVEEKRALQVASFFDRETEQDFWEERTLNSSAELLEWNRNLVLSNAGINRDSMILNLNAGNGLFIKELQKAAPEGSLYFVVSSEDEENYLNSLRKDIELSNEFIINSQTSPLPHVFKQWLKDGYVFDAIVGRNVFSNKTENLDLSQLRKLLTPIAKLSLSESLPEKGSRLSDYLKDEVDPELLKKFIQKENEMFSAISKQSNSAFGENSLSNLLETEECEQQTKFFNTKLFVSQKRFDRWFHDPKKQNKDIDSYGKIFSQSFEESDSKKIKQALKRKILGRKINWRIANLFIIIENK